MRTDQAHSHVHMVVNNRGRTPTRERITHREMATLGIALAKSAFQPQSAVLDFLSKLDLCPIGMEACAAPHCCTREIAAALGHDVRLIPPDYVRPFVKRQRGDAADAEAICEAVSRPNTRFEPVKTKEQQSALVPHRSRDLLMRQRTMIPNVIRAQQAHRCLRHEAAQCSQLRGFSILPGQDGAVP